MTAEEELPDFADENDQDNGVTGTKKEEVSRGAITASGFRDFLLKAELMKGIVECGFEQPSEVQHACIPQAVLGTDILCQAKSGMGKTAVFVLAVLQLVDTSEQVLRAVVLGHTRELAYQIKHEFDRLGKHLSGVKVAAVFGGVPMETDREAMKTPPHILVGTPGRVLGCIKGKEPILKLDHVTHFIVDECDRCIDELELRRDVQQVFIRTPKKKQVMMFSATMNPECSTVCKRFMQTPHEITVESEAKLTLHGLLQYTVKLEEKTKNKKLIDLLDTLEFNQVVIFVRTVKRALALDGLLRECNFPSMTLHELPKEHASRAGKGDVPGVKHSRIERLKLFKDFHKRILVTTDLFGRGMDVERLNIVINYDMPEDDTMYLHRVGRCGRFGTKGLAISFVSSESDTATLAKIQARFEVNIAEMPSSIDTTSYLNA